MSETPCSRAGCRARSTWAVQWRNPKIHAEGRIKIWRACDAHVDYLQQYLEARAFPVRVTRLEEPR